MTLPLRCACGQVEGSVTPSAAYTRATCYCRDCQAFARFLARDGITDAHGGTDIVPMAPSGVRIARGHERIECMSMSDRGPLRWFAACCRTPLGNTARTPHPFFLGLITTCLDASGPDLEAVYGRRGRIALFRKQARGPVAATPVRYAAGASSIVAHLLAARLRGRPRSPFFDADGRPIRTPHVLSRDERARLNASEDHGSAQA
ncbi:DUF6151 family protein [Luteimonas abyssi]|uniref:DUF6151 family protein n=1 Tax=Luteimonas abyssi TaxID=1247514 RepID=UPI000A604AD6|nr:DUF6151 family protein [Luteimonas abyssi]